MLYLLVLLAIFAATVAKPRRKPTDKPNFVMLFVDDMGFGDTGFNGNKTVSTPNIDRLAFNGKILTDWYAACPICSGSRASLLTGRQYPRSGMPAGLGPSTNVGLPLEETTVAEHLKTAGYATAAVGKWHLGQRRVYLPANRGFDSYLGIPYSPDMGQAKMSACAANETVQFTQASWPREAYAKANFLREEDTEVAASRGGRAPGSVFLPLVSQEHNETRIVEQPVDLTHLAEKYSDFATDFVQRNKDRPFFLYVPFSHVHTVFMTTGAASTDQPKQYAGCRFRNKMHGGPINEALAETDWLVGNIHQALKDAGVEENTLILFTGDNGPWMVQGSAAAGSIGMLTGSYSGYWNVGKGSTWEGGIRSASFAYWKGQIAPYSRSSEVISSMDVFPTLSRLAGLQLPTDRVYDGRDMTKVLLSAAGRSEHKFLFFYGGCGTQVITKENHPSAVRHGRWKAHFCTGPGLGGCKECHHKAYKDYPLLFDIAKDPAESTPMNPDGGKPCDAEAAEAMESIKQALRTELATFSFGKLRPVPDEAEEVMGYGICCDWGKLLCDCSSEDAAARKPQRRHLGLLSIGTREFHDAFHADVPPPASFLARGKLAHPSWH